MLEPVKLKMVEELFSSATREELVWLNGYLSGLLAGQHKAPEAAAPAPAATNLKTSTARLTIAYGTETGNAKKLASEFAARAKKSGLQAKLVSLDQYRLTDLPKEENFLTVISTQGDGEPPAGAKKFFEHIHNNGFRLEKVRYGVLALGDTSYPLFCKAGEDVDQQLNKLGGERIVSLQKCDTDFGRDADAWFESVLSRLKHAPAGAPASAGTVVVKKSTGKKIYEGRVLTNVILNDRGSSKEVHHIEIEAEGVDYQPGDALGLVPQNPESLVGSILSLANADGDRKVDYRGEEISRYHLLKKKVNIAWLPERVVGKYASIVGQDIPATRMNLAELLRIYPLSEPAQLDAVLQVLEPMAPRLYSISSSPEAHGGEVHLTVARDTFRINDELRYGLCSDYLSCFSEGSSFEFYIHPNHRFRLPEDDKDVIMIGPGTGVAPFRSFLAQRDATGALGRNWLFFGDQHFVTDFLYQSELLAWLDTGTLTRLNVAFSRDQAEKIYVQHKMRQHGKELFDWIENGASFYVCGAREPMSVDVEQTLLELIEQYGSKSREEAEAYLESLSEAGRYLKDVY